MSRLEKTLKQNDELLKYFFRPNSGKRFLPFLLPICGLLLRAVPTIIRVASIGMRVARVGARVARVAAKVARSKVTSKVFFHTLFAFCHKSLKIFHRCSYE